MGAMGSDATSVQSRWRWRWKEKNLFLFAFFLSLCVYACQFLINWAVLRFLVESNLDPGYGTGAPWVDTPC